MRIINAVNVLCMYILNAFPFSVWFTNLHLYGILEAAI